MTTYQHCCVRWGSVSRPNGQVLLDIQPLRSRGTASGDAVMHCVGVTPLQPISLELPRRLLMPHARQVRERFCDDAGSRMRQFGHHAGGFRLHLPEPGNEPSELSLCTIEQGFDGFFVCDVRPDRVSSTTLFDDLGDNLFCLARISCVVRDDRKVIVRETLHNRLAYTTRPARNERDLPRVRQAKGVTAQRHAIRHHPVPCTDACSNTRANSDAFIAEVFEDRLMRLPLVPDGVYGQAVPRTHRNQEWKEYTKGSPRKTAVSQSRALHERFSGRSGALVAASNAKRLCFEDKVGDRTRIHLLHCVTPMDLHRDLAQTQMRSDLFVL